MDANIDFNRLLQIINPNPVPIGDGFGGYHTLRRTSFPFFRFIFPLRFPFLKFFVLPGFWGVFELSGEVCYLREPLFQQGEGWSMCKSDSKEKTEYVHDFRGM